MSLQEKAMLVNLTIHQWTGRKFDRAATASINNLANAASDAGRYNKQLVRKETLASIALYASRIRNQHYHMTLPWSDGGQRLLPAAFFMNYRDKISGLKQQFEEAVEEFLNWYGSNRQHEAVRLGHLYDPNDYPSILDLRSCYGVNTEFFPVPAAEDFRTSIGADEQDEVRQQIVASIADRQKKIFEDCRTRILKLLDTSVSASSSNAFVEKLDTLSTHLDGLNVMNDPKVASAALHLRAMATHIRCGVYAYAQNTAEAIRCILTSE